jgi:RNA polymerase sigma-70 factor (ECF subfamily)
MTREEAPDPVAVGEVDFVRSALRRLGVPAARLDDALQDVFEVLTRRGAPAGGADGLRAYLWGIARRIAWADRRRHRRAASVTTEISGAPTQEIGLTLTQLLRRLTPEDLDVVLLTHGLGCSAAEASARLALPLTTVQWRLRRARHVLQEAEVPRRRPLLGVPAGWFAHPACAVVAAWVVSLEPLLPAVDSGLLPPPVLDEVDASPRREVRRIPEASRSRATTQAPSPDPIPAPIAPRPSVLRARPRPGAFAPRTPPPPVDVGWTATHRPAASLEAPPRGSLVLASPTHFSSRLELLLRDV